MEPKIHIYIYNQVGFIINLNLFIATRLACYGCRIHTVKGDTEVQYINVFISMVAPASRL